MNEQADKWSDWHPLSPATQRSAVPNEPGIYEFRASFEIERLRGKSPIVYIGSATSSLCVRLVQQRIGDPGKYRNRAEKWMAKAGLHLEFRYKTTGSAEEAEYQEALQLFEYEHDHWELPPGNDRLDRRPIISRIEVRRNPFNEQALRELCEQYKSPEGVAHSLDVPVVVIENFITYWLVACGSAVSGEPHPI